MNDRLHWGDHKTIQRRRQQGQTCTDAHVAKILTQPTRAELREQLTQAVKNTAAMEQGKGVRK